jgi:hypothetical protein
MIREEEDVFMLLPPPNTNFILLGEHRIGGVCIFGGLRTRFAEEKDEELWTRSYDGKWKKAKGSRWMGMLGFERPGGPFIRLCQVHGTSLVRLVSVPSALWQSKDAGFPPFVSCIIITHCTGGKAFSECVAWTPWHRINFNYFLSRRRMMR